MHYPYFGNTGIRVSDLCLGTMTFGNEADEAESIAIMDQAFEAGIQFFDTADLYNKGCTEEIVGRWLQGRRRDVVLASKVYFPMGRGVNQRGSSRLHIIQGVEDSLKRLQTDYIDILYLHHWDPHTAIEESLRAMTDLVAHGKVLYIAVSNFSAWQVAEAIHASREHQLAPISAIQPMYNLVKRQAEVELFPMADYYGLAVCPYSPMGAGLLTGKYQRNEGGRIEVNPMYAVRFENPEYMEVSNRFVAFAQERGYDPAALSVAWAATHPSVTSPIIGARNTAQLTTALSSLDIPMTPELRDEIDALSIEPATATDRERADYTTFQKK